MTTDGRAFAEAMDRAPALEQDLGDILEIGILRTDCDLVVRGWNRWLESASGQLAADVVGRSLLDVFPTLAGGQTEAAFRSAAAGATVVLSQRLHGYALPLPLTAGAPGVEYMQQSARLMPLVAAGREIVGVLAIIEDVTDRVVRENELKAAIGAAQMASKAKSDFLASMSHELRTPLSAMIGYSELLSSEISGPLSATQHDHVSRLQLCARHLLGIVEEILSFARIDAGREEVRVEEVDIVGLTEEAVAVLMPSAEKKGLALTVELPTCPVVVTTDAVKLRQVLINLLGNAVKFTDQGAVNLSLVCPEGASTVEFRIEDTGPGIAAEDLTRIFEAFTQVDQSRKRAKGGTGLGLPVSRHLAEMLGGVVSVDSHVGVGSVFSLILPLRYFAPPDTSAPDA